jgi:hypothetical protein
MVPALEGPNPPGVNSVGVGRPGGTAIRRFHLRLLTVSRFAGEAMQRLSMTAPTPFSAACEPPPFPPRPMHVQAW